MREINRPQAVIVAALDDLTGEGIVETSGQPDERLYCLPEGEPTTMVVRRLIARATRSQELRRIVVAHILRAAVG